MAFEDLYRAQWPRLVRLALLLNGSREVAEDLAHDAFIRFAGSEARVADPPAWLRQVVVNLTRDRHRHAAVAARRLPAPPGPWHDPDIDETWVALGTLPHRYRAALVLRFYEDLPVEEVAGLLGCPTGTAKSQIHRGLRLLKERLQ